MLKNKIYKYLSNEIFRNFITILLTFSAIAWVVRAVNFLDLMVDDGYSSVIYFKYSLLNISTIMTRFVPLAFLLSLTISIIKLERQQEFLILWTIGLAKIRIANVFLLVAIFITLFQLMLSLFVNPYLLNKSRTLLGNTESLQINSALRSNEFIDAYRGITFYIERKNSNNELINILIKDEMGNFNTAINEVGEKKNSTIIAKKGFIDNNKLILFDGLIQTLSYKNEIKNIKFTKTELNLKNITTNTVKLPKIQETSSSSLFKCVFNDYDKSSLNYCSKDYKNEATQALSRRLGAPLYIPLVSIIISFLLIHKKESKFIFLKKYILFILSFVILILAEIILKYTGLFLSVASSYFILPIAVSFLSYIYLLKKMKTR